MLAAINPKQVLKIVLLIAVRDGAERILIRSTSDNHYEMHEWITGQSYEMVPPPHHTLQQLPAELAVFESVWARLSNRLRHCIRHARRGRFKYPIGSGSVLVDYRAQWVGSKVREMEFNLSLAPELKDAAHVMLNPPPIKGFENIDD